jgi:hypothetical protein
MIRVAASGTWLYDGTVRTLVRVIETDRDFWFDIAEEEGQLEDGELPELRAWVGLLHPQEAGMGSWPAVLAGLARLHDRRGREGRS